MIKNIDNKKKLVIIIGSVITVVLLVLFSFLLNSNSLSSSDPSILGDAQYTCYPWKEGGWSSWIDGTPPSGLTADYPPTACSTVTSYTRIEVATSPLVCPDGTLPCYRTNTYTRTRTISSCDPGEYLDGSSCKICPKGYSCSDGLMKIECSFTSTEYQDQEGQTSCKNCVGTVSEDRTSCTSLPTIDYIGISPSGVDIKVGKTQTLSVYAYSEGESVKIDNSLVSWSTTNSSVATVSNGTITAKSSGTATITATYNGQPAYCHVTVTEDSDFIVSIPAIRTVAVGSSTTLTPTLTGAGDNDQITYTFTSSNTSVATVTNAGVVTGKKAGSAVITVTATRASDNAKRTDTCDLTVEEVAATISISPKAIYLALDDSASVNVTVKNSSGTVMQSELTISEYDTSIVSVASGGYSYNQSYGYYSLSNKSLNVPDSHTRVKVCVKGSTVCDYYDVYTKCTKWNPVSSKFTETGQNRTLGHAHVTADECIYVDYTNDCTFDSSTNKYTCSQYYNRCCGTVTPPVEEPVCYVNKTTGDYKWTTSSPGEGYTIDSTITSESACKKPVEPTYACYVNQTTGDYKWTTTSPGEGYTIDSSIASESACKKPVEPTYACYVNQTTGDYKWSTTSPGSGYTIDSSIASESACKKPVEPTYACYVNQTTGDYKWSATSPGSGYTIDSSIASESACKKPVEPTYACYVNQTTGDYKWSTTSPGSGYTIDSSIASESACKKPVEPTYACYVNPTTGDYKWTTTSPGEGYTIDSNIASESACVPPELPACYKDASNNYVWGLYHNDNNYTLVADILTEEDCHEIIDVPMTASDVRNIIYVFVGILMLFGIYVIYYSYSKKKLNK